MCDDGCANCAALEAENAALRAKIQRLEREIERLKRKLLIIRRFCQLILQKTRHILSQPKGVKFTTWQKARGADPVADAVEKMTH